MLRAGNVLNVMVAPLDKILGQTGCDDVRVNKLDVGGADLEALRGAKRTLKQWRPYIILEHNRDAWAAAGATRADLHRLLVDEHRYEINELPGGNETVSMLEAVSLEPRRFRLPWQH
jgi:hypothetical protein